MRRLPALVLAAFLTLAPAAAQATDDSGPVGSAITRWDQTYVLNADGSADVRIEVDYAYGSWAERGPYWSFPLRVQYDDTYLRVYDYTDFRASSPTGAPAEAYVDRDDNWVEVRVGEESTYYSLETQTFVLEYTVDNVMNETTAEELGTGTANEVVGEEFYWNAIGTGWTIPIANATVTVTADQLADGANCFVGAYGSNAQCDRYEQLPDGSLRFSHPRLEPGEALTILALYPPGTAAADPELVYASDMRRAFDPNPATVGAAGGLVAVGALVVGLLARLTGRDARYRAQVPGLAPASGQPASLTTAAASLPVAVQFQPPEGLRPGTLGTLIDEKADTRDVTATLIDLAVRGYLRIEEVDDPEDNGKKADYRLVRMRTLKEAKKELLGFEYKLFRDLFASRKSVTLAKLRTTFSDTVSAVKDKLYDRVMELGWFRASPTVRRVRWAGVGLAVLAAGVVAMFVLSAWGLSMVGAGLSVVGLLVVATTNLAPARTAEGSRVLAQTVGFKRYLETAEANQLRFEEGEDVFSRYLPYAIAFGIAETWTERVADAARAQGLEPPDPHWYVGYGAAHLWMHPARFGERLASFTDAASSSMAAPTPGSSGGSGFSSGGGFSGGGGGGGGGGGW